MKNRLKSMQISLNLGRCLLLSLYILLVALLVFYLGEGLFAASIGASAFSVFTFPSTDSTRPRFLIGGYVCSGLWGVALWYGRSWLSGYISEEQLLLIGCCALAAFLAALTMTVLDYEHPSAIAFALSLVLSQRRPIFMAGVTMVCIVVLCLIRKLVLHFGRDKPAVILKEKESDAS